MKEMLEIVDKDGNPTGEIVEKFEAKSKNLLHKIVCLFILNEKDQVLLEKRSLNKKIHPGRWALCEGHVGIGEDNKIAMQRELKEELGVDINLESIVFLCKILKEKEKGSSVTFVYYTLMDKNESEFTIQESELSEVKWLDFNEYKNMIINNDERVSFSNNKGNIEMLSRIEEILLKRE